MPSGTFVLDPRYATTAGLHSCLAGGASYTYASLDAAGSCGMLALFDDRQLRKRVCLKVFSERAAARTTVPEGVAREAEALGAQQGCYAPAFFGIGMATDAEGGSSHWAILQEYLPRHRSVARIIEERDGIARYQDGGGAKALAEELLQIATAIDSTHRNGIVHRDLSPLNVMALNAGETFGDVRIIDFGQSTRQHAYDGTEWYSGPHLGTRGFAPPEMFGPVHSTGRASRSTSSFSLGAMAHFMMTGKRPFEKELEEERRAHDRITQVASPAALDAEVRRYYAAVAEIERASIPICSRDLAMLKRDATLRELMLLADWCTHPLTHARPTMEEAIWMLESMLGIADGRPSPTPSERIDALLDNAFATYTKTGDEKSDLRRTAALAHYCGSAGRNDARLLAANALELLGEAEYADSLAVSNYRAAANGGSVAAKNSLRRLGKMG